MALSVSIHGAPKTALVHASDDYIFVMYVIHYCLAGVVMSFLGPFYGAIAVPSVTRCRCCRRRRRRCCGHRCAGGVRQWRRATVATPGEWQCGVRRLAVANWPNIFQMLLVCVLCRPYLFLWSCFSLV